MTWYETKQDPHPEDGRIVCDDGSDVPLFQFLQRKPTPLPIQFLFPMEAQHSAYKFVGKAKYYNHII